MALYEFETTWRLRAPLPDVWQAIVDSDRWPEWWKGVERVVLLTAGDDHGVGSVRRTTWRSRLPYALTFDAEVERVEPMSLIEVRASGELEGTGTWHLSETDGVTHVRYVWRVRTTRWWMNILGPLPRPAFRWNHDQVMRNGAAGLATLLKADLLQA
jgi:uncharacterized protein YndB with AHSA1/START domain